MNGYVKKVKEGYGLTEKGVDEAINGVIEREVLPRIQDQYVGLLSTMLKEKILEEKDERILEDEDYAADILLSELEMFRSMQFSKAVSISQLPAQQFVESMLRNYHPPWLRDLSEDQLRETASRMVESLGNEISKDEIRTLRKVKRRIDT